MLESRENFEKTIKEFTEMFEAALPKAPEMSTEIERAFLVDRDAIPYDLDTLPSVSIVQGYIAVDGDTEVRVRKKGDDALITIKSGSGLVRIEREFPIEEEAAAVLLPLSGDRLIEKTRYIINENGNCIELDIFTGPHSGLILIEVEFEDEKASEAFTPPDWFGEEVTEDSRYMNRNLAVDGIPE